MSRDIEARCDCCGSYIFDFNVTYNLSPMLAEAGFGWDDLDGKKAADCANLIADVLTTLECDPPRFEALNPKNGWGSYVGLCAVLREMLEKMRAHPNVTVHT